MFGELLAMPNVQALRESDEAHAPHLALLELFAYGTYAQYRAAPAGTFPPLKDEQLEKLRMLSIVSLAHQSATVPYATLQAELDIAASELRQLEDLVIETIYAGLLDARLNQKQTVLVVRRAASRDVRLSDIDGMISKLRAFMGSAGALSQTLHATVADARLERDAHERRRAEVAQKVDTVRKNLKEHLALTGATADSAGGMFDALDDMDVDKPRRARGKRSRVPMDRRGPN